MESLGSKLKSARENKGYTYDQVSQEIHISSRYLKALEEEDFAGFPGEPFLLGFLRNYGEYLGLDAQELVSLYRAIKIQEQPVPVEELLKPPSPFPFKLLFGTLIVLAILGVIGGGVYFFFHFLQEKPVTVIKVREPVEYIMNTNILERRFYQGDSILIPYGEEQYILKLANVGDAVTISTPDRDVILDLSQEVTVDLNDDGVVELRITAADFVKNGSSTGALLRFEMDNVMLLFNGETISEASLGGTGAGSPLTLINPNNTTVANTTVIFSSPSAYPFTLQAIFQGYCMFRHEILLERDHRDRIEKYYQKADELNIQAQNGIRIWVSNAATVKLQVIGGGRTVPLELGGAGEIVVADVRWVRDDESRYRLVLMRLE